MPGEILSLRRLLRSLAPDVVHLHSAKAGLAGRAALRGRLPTIFQPHAWSFLAAQGVVGRSALAWERLSSRWSDRIVCVSESERTQGVQAGIDARWAVVPNGVDLDRFRPGDRARARSGLGLDHGPWAVCVGRLSHQKGQDLLLKAWSEVSARVPEARLALVGSGPDEASLRAAAPPGVTFVGATTEVPQWLEAADLVVVPSRWEGMSLAMLEALASGRSIVISDVAGASEAVGGAAGAVIPVGDIRSLSEALVERLRDEDLREREGAAARGRAEAAFGIERTLSAMLAVYDAVLQDRPAGE